MLNLRHNLSLPLQKSRAHSELEHRDYLKFFATQTGVANFTDQ